MIRTSRSTWQLYAVFVHPAVEMLTVGPKHNERRSKGRAAPKLCKRPHGSGPVDRGLEVSVGAYSWPTRVPAMRWRNAREVPAGPQGGTIADVCIMKKNVCFSIVQMSKNNPLWAPFMRTPVWVHLTVIHNVASGFPEALILKSTLRVLRTTRGLALALR